MGKLIHGSAKRNNESKAYISWKHMRQRCNNPNDKNYPYYGGRGISVCARWDSYENFINDMGECPETLELDRINCNGNYEPENCRWADRITQVNNRRNCEVYAYNGKELNLKQWAKEVKISYTTLVDRIKSGWDFEKAIETPAKKALTAEDVASILNLYQQGLNKKEISIRTKISYDQVRYAIKTKG